jgi:hypothetical protein
MEKEIISYTNNLISKYLIDFKDTNYYSSINTTIKNMINNNKEKFYQFAVALNLIEKDFSFKDIQKNRNIKNLTDKLIEMQNPYGFFDQYSINLEDFDKKVK